MVVVRRSRIPSTYKLIASALARRPFSTSKQPLLLEFCRDLRARGLVHGSHPPLQWDNESEESEKGHLYAAAAYLSRLPPVLYAGFDPTASSLHVGNLLVVAQLLRARSLFGCQAIALVGGATVQVGDPSGKSKERVQMENEVVAENSRRLAHQLQLLATNADNAATAAGKDASNISPLRIVNNLEWYEKISMLEFLRLARVVRISNMLRLGPIRSRLDLSHAGKGEGLSYTEFSYQILQAYDWERLSRDFECFFQIGGSDQLGNLEAGYEFIRERGGQHPACGIFLPLLTDKHGVKLGKSTMRSGAESPAASPAAEETSAQTPTSPSPSPREDEKQEGLWLDPQLTSPFAFYQYFRQMHDDQAGELLPYFSLSPLEEVRGVLDEHNGNLGKWVAQQHLADELTRLVHGESGWETARRCSRLLFEGSIHEMESLTPECIRGLFGAASTFRLPTASPPRTMGELADATNVGRGGGMGSKKMRQGGFYLNGKRRSQPEENFHVGAHLLQGRFSLVRWGKRNYSLVEWI